MFQYSEKILVFLIEFRVTGIATENLQKNFPWFSLRTEV